MLWSTGTLRLNFDAISAPKRVYIAISVLRGRIVEISEAKPWWRAVASPSPAGGWIPPDRAPPEA